MPEQIVKHASSANAPSPESYVKKGLEARYDELTATRHPHLQRAREASRLTIPSLLPPEGHSATNRMYKPWQSIGSRGVNHLAAKLLLTLLPPVPFFRYQLSQTAIDQMLAGKDGANEKTKFEEALAKYEREIMTEIESGPTRVSAFEAMLHAIVAGNVCLYMPPKGGSRVYHLDSYVVVRDGMGNLLEIITEEKLSRQSVPDEIKPLVDERCQDTEKVIRLLTCSKRDGKKFDTWQEVKGVEVPGSRGSYPLDASPYIVIRWVKIDGEDYGRGHVEGLQGDLTSVEGLSQSIVEGSAAAAKILFLVNPNGVTKQKTVAEAPNGAIRSGNAADVTVLQSQKSADLRVARECRSEIKNDLEASFLLASAVQRNAERVTAEEVRTMIGELESALGGVYALLAQEFQLPLVHRLVHQMIKAKKLLPLPKGIVRPTIVTGLDALSRGHDLQRLDVFIGGARDQLGPEVVAQYVNVSDYLTRRATALNLDKKGLIRSEEEVAEAQQREQMASLVQTAAPQGVKAAADLAKEGMNA